MNVPQHIANMIVDPKAYAAGKPVDDAFAWLRVNAPFAQMEPEGFHPIWVATRHKDIQAVELAPDLFCSGANLPTLAPRAALEARAKSGFTGARTLVSMDPPEHNTFRRMTQDWFMPKNLKGIEPRIRERARATMDRMKGLGGTCDFAIDVAMNYPLQIIMEILGIPDTDEPMMLKLTQEFFGSRDPDFAGDGSGDDAASAQANLQKVVNQLKNYFTDLTHARRQKPTGDLASAIANGEVNGELIDMESAIGYYIIAATAGHDTTSNTLSYAMWALAERPELLARLRTEPAAMRPFLDEVLRWGTPVKHFMRTATRDEIFAGAKVKKGDLVMLSYASANRDEDIFDQPFEFDIDRRPNRHLAFGYGPHLCLGQNLAMLELRTFFEELLPHLEAVELDGEPRRVAANFVCGPKSVPIHYRFS